MTSFTQDQLDSIASALQPSLNTHLESLLNERFAALRTSLEGSWAEVQKEWWEKLSSQVHSSLEEVRGQLPEEIRKAAPSGHNVPEPSILSDSSYSGGHPALRGFIHVVRDTLSSRSHAFPSETACVNWVARHFKPIGGSSNNWWMGLLQENAVAQGVRDHYQFSGLPFIIAPLLTLDAFLAAMVDEFGDKLAHETALKNLQECKMGNMKIGDFNSHFKSLSGLVLDAPESIRTDYYKRALSAPIRRQAILRADWASALTLSEKMSIATLASQQLDEANGVSHSKHLQPQSSQHMIHVPHDTNAMEVDVIGLSSHPSSFPKKSYVDECKRQKLCTRCLGPYNETHRTSSGSATCPNAAASLQSKIDFLKNSRKSNLPKTVPHPPPGPPQPVQRTVAAVTTPIAPPAGHHPHPYPPQFAWPPQHPSYPPMQYGYPAYPPPPPPPQSHPQTSSVPPVPSTTISAVFPEYADLYHPVYYDLPGADFTEPVHLEPQVTELPSTPAPVESVPVSSMTFTGSSASDSRLILSVSLLVGKRLIPAKALIDSGLGGGLYQFRFCSSTSSISLSTAFSDTMYFV